MAPSIATGKKPVKKIPRARNHYAPSQEMRVAAARLRKLIRQKLHGSNTVEGACGLFALDKYADRVIRPVTYNAARDGVSPTPEEIAFQIRVYHEALLHFSAFCTLLGGLVDTGPSIRWVDGFDALQLMWAADLLDDQLREFQRQMITSCTVGNAMLFERAVRLAVTGLKLIDDGKGGAK